MTKEKLIKLIKEVAGIKEIVLETPENNSFGDYTTNVALVGKGQVVKGKSENPRKKADEIVGKLKSDESLSKIVDKIEIAGPGFINFWLKTDVLVDNLRQIDASKDDFGKSKKGKGKIVIVDYSSPNIAKPFGIGHLRSTIIGQALYNLYKTLGYEVVGDNHLGDWGTQFGKLLYMINTTKTSDLSIENLEKLYVEFHKLAETDSHLDEEARVWFKKLEDGDLQAKKIWQECVDVSLAEFERVYKMLGVKIDFAFGESYYSGEMKRMVDDPGIQRHLINGEEGAKVVDLERYKIKTPLMFLKNDGATTYAARDLATISFRVRKWEPFLIIYEVGAEQTFHFQQVFAAARVLGLVEDKVRLVHTAHGLYLAPDGKKFSTRKGKTIKLEEVLDEAIRRAEKIGNNQKVAKDVGIGAIKYFDLMHSVGSNVIFDWEKVMNLEGNSGPYLQYTAARCNSVLSKATFKGSSLQGEYSNLTGEELEVVRTLVHFPEVVVEAAENYAPNLLCNYLYDLAGKYNRLYNSTKIIGSEAENFRLALTFGVGQVLKNGLKILGIETPERM